MQLSKGWITITVTIAILLSIELFLQTRAHIRYGNSMVTKVLGLFRDDDSQKLFRFDEELDMFLLTPSITHSSKKITTRTNSIGLRSPEIELNKEDGEFRFVVVGASTIQGATAESNEKLFSYKLYDELSEKYPEKKISFINAGIAGYKVENQIKLFDKVLKHYDLDLALIYTGVNNFEYICQGNEKDKKDYGLRGVDLPKWILSYELITKNTTWSKPGINNGSFVSEEDINSSEYKNDVKRLIRAIASTGTYVYVLSNAKSYRKNMPLSDQKDLSALSTYYYPCLNLNLLYLAYSKFNDALKVLSEQYENVNYIDTERVVPGGARFFVDPVHFTDAGAAVLAEFVSREIENENLLFMD